MSDVYLLAAAQGQVQSFSGQTHAEQVRPILKSALDKAGVEAARVQEIHWHGGDQEFWLSALNDSFGFKPNVARFQWPSAPLLAHYVLQGGARALASGDRDLILMAQEGSDQVIVLLLGSPALAQAGSLAPRARLTTFQALSSAPDGLAASAHSMLKLSADGKVEWLASARKLDPGPFAPGKVLVPQNNAPSGDLFLLSSLLDNLDESSAKRGLLLSEGPQKSGLVTVVERG